MNIKTLISKLKKEYSIQCCKPKGFCYCENPIMVGDDGLRCVECRKLIEVEIEGYVSQENGLSRIIKFIRRKQ